MKPAWIIAAAFAVLPCAAWAQDFAAVFGLLGGIATGAVRGVSKTLGRTGIGIYEVVTAPIPPYGPNWTSYLSPRPQYPDSYRPRKWTGSSMATDHYFGFSGGDVAPWFPGSHFRIFDN